MKISFVIPTYNEHGNITRLIERINQITKNYELENEIIIVDDNSTDGTIEDINDLQKNQSNLNLKIRKKPMGIGSAHRDGYNLAQGDLIISMDADLSHPPDKIPHLIKKIKNGYDFVIGSRYMEGSGSNKGVIFRIMSKFGSFYLSLMLRIEISDFSNGYRAIRKSLWEKIKKYKYSNQNNFLIESIYYAYKHGGRIGEIPTKFRERELGKSKTNLFREAIKAIFLPLKLRYNF